MKLFQFSRRPSRTQAAIAVFVALFFVGLLPFASALEVHHIFAEVDHDGHEHSDFDLCQWVQAHGSGSIDLDHADVGIPIPINHKQWFSNDTFYSSIALLSQESRGPPLFLSV